MTVFCEEMEMSEFRVGSCVVDNVPNGAAASVPHQQQLERGIERRG